MMKIMIVGCGSVGTAICTQLANENHDITVISRDPQELSELSNSTDVFPIVGNGADISLLRKAGAKDADLLIAVTNSDELNILCCLVASQLGTRHTIARVRNPEYTELTSLMNDKEYLSLTINPELALAQQIDRMLRFPAAAKLDTFCHGRVELAEFTVPEGASICHVPLNQLRNHLNLPFLVCGVLRDKEAYIPSGDFELQANDIISITAPQEVIPQFFRAIGIYRQPVKNVMIAGGGRTTYYLQSLLQKRKISATIIEPNKELCENLATAFDSNIICDRIGNQECLLEEGMERADAFLALSSNDEENVIASLFAKTKQVPKVITMIGTMSYIDFFQSAGLDSVVSPKSATKDHILRYVRAISSSQDSAEIESLHKIMDDRIEALEFHIKEDIENLTQIPLRDLHAKKGFLIACIVHEGNVILPTGNDRITKGDTVIVLTKEAQMNSIKDVLDV
jgi:trk system potassium uptake protein TrkA